MLSDSTFFDRDIAFVPYGESHIFVLAIFIMCLFFNCSYWAAIKLREKFTFNANLLFVLKRHFDRLDRCTH
jgi:hypothetical protein